MTPEQLADDFARMAAELGDLVVDTNRVAGEVVLADSQPPVDTGYLDSTGEVRADAAGFDVVYTAPYAPFVHARQPFLTQALTRQESAVVELYFDAVKRAIH